MGICNIGSRECIMLLEMERNRTARETAENNRGGREQSGGRCMCSILPQPTERAGGRGCWGGVLPWSPRLDAGRFCSGAPWIYSSWHEHVQRDKHGMRTTHNTRWAGVEISFNFLRWRLSFEMVGQTLFRSNNVVECPFLLVCCFVFPQKDAMRGVEWVTIATQLELMCASICQTASKPVLSIFISAF